MKIDGAHAYYEATRLVLAEKITLEQLLDVAAEVALVSQGHQWWIGDLLVDGERRFGDDFAQATAVLEQARVEPQTQLNYRWVASRIDHDRRREQLTWSHHEAVARLTAKQQTKALDYAIKNELTVRQLRDYVALTWPEPKQEPLPDSPLDDAADQRRLERIVASIDAGEQLPEEDLRWLVQLARQALRGRSE